MDEYNYYIECNNIIQNIIKDKSCTEIEINNIKVGDYIYIEFIPDSQKYIYTLYPKCGCVELITINKVYNSIQKKYENVYDIIIRNNNNIEENLLHDSVSNAYSFGYGYSYNIFLLS